MPSSRSSSSIGPFRRSFNPFTPCLSIRNSHRPIHPKPRWTGHQSHPDESVCTPLGFIRYEESRFAVRIHVHRQEGQWSFIESILQFGIGVGGAGNTYRVRTFSGGD